MIEQKLVAAEHAPIEIFDRLAPQPHCLVGDLANPRLDACQAFFRRAAESLTARAAAIFCRNSPSAGWRSLSSTSANAADSFSRSAALGNREKAAR